MGSGWGDKISIIQRSESLEVERVIFTPREGQPLMNYLYLLNGSASENSVQTGRSMKPNISTTKWHQNKLIITTKVPFQDPEQEKWNESTFIQTLWLEDASNAPWEPKLIIETFRDGVLGGLASTSRTVYSKGYR